MFCSPEIRRPKAETRKKTEIRRPKDSNIEHPMAVAAAFQVLDVGCWMFRISGSEWPGPILEQRCLSWQTRFVVLTANFFPLVFVRLLL